MVKLTLKQLTTLNSCSRQSVIRRVQLCRRRCSLGRWQGSCCNRFNRRVKLKTAFDAVDSKNCDSGCAILLRFSIGSLNPGVTLSYGTASFRLRRVVRPSRR